MHLWIAHGVGQRLDPHTPVRVRCRKLLFHGCRHGAHFVAGLLDRYATLQPADDAERMVRAALLRPIDRHREENPCVRCRRELRSSDLAERPRHDADDPIAFAVECDGTLDDVGVCAEPTAPERFAQHHDSRTARLLIFRPEGSADNSAQPAAREKTRRSRGWRSAAPGPGRPWR